MTTYVLVHGSFHGGWCWACVAPLLRDAGHEVFAPTLTGLGERAHLAGPQVNFSTHVQDVVNVLTYEGLRDVILVGHSYGSLVVTAVADRVPDQLQSVVLLDAAAPTNGQSAWGIFSETNRIRFLAEAARQGTSDRIPPPEPQQFGVVAQADADWMRGRLTPHPLASWQEPISLTNPLGEEIPRLLVCCTSGRSERAIQFFRGQAEQHGWRYRELATGHDAMVTAPFDLARLLLDVAPR